MKPLQAIAMGLLIVALEARVGGFDLYVDPVGWVLVLVGLRGLPTALPFRSELWYVGAVAAVTSVPLWVPTLAEALDEADPALAWACNLPKFAFFALLCAALARSAAASEDAKSAAWLRMAMTGLVVVMVAPVLVFGAGWTALGPSAGLAAQVVLIWAVVLYFSYSGRAWATASTRATDIG